MVRTLAAVATACRAADADPAGAAPGILAARELPSSWPLLSATKPAVQVDTALPLRRKGVSRAVADDAGRAVDLLFRLHPTPAGHPWPATARHSTGGTATSAASRSWSCSTRASDWVRRRRIATTRARTTKFAHRRASTVRDLVAEAIRDGVHEVVLDDQLVDDCSVGRLDVHRLPASVELSVFLTAHSRTAVDRGDYLLVVGPNLGGQEAGRGLGRFADLIGAEAQEFLAEVVAAEADVRSTEPVVTELVYRPLRARSANVAVRPVTRGYELPVGVAPTLPPDRVVHVDELSVGITDDRFCLWWIEWTARLILTAGHMLNHAASSHACARRWSS